MAKAIEIIITGVDAIDRKLHALPTRVQKKVIRQAQRQVCKELKRVIKRNAPHGKTGDMARSVVVRAGKRKVGRITTWVGYARGMQRGNKWYESFNELGAPNINYRGEHSVKRSFEMVENAAYEQLRRFIVAGIEKEAASEF
jgi:hypothetical protein